MLSSTEDFPELWFQLKTKKNQIKQTSIPNHFQFMTEAQIKQNHIKQHQSKVN